MKKLISGLFAVLILGSLGRAQEEGPYFENTIVPRKGRLFAIDFDAGSRTVRVSVVGKTMKGISSSRYSVTAETTDAKGLARQLDLVSTASGYQFKEQLAPKKDVKIKVHDKETRESELFLLKP
ncbi:hypothetical protein B9G69_015095 [Bdellovibrio sp. SKB1291214]|uniref:hypothetical protein n=1 Tax=Bdellovibrio sp. SKB1291214 TaxID=1732569 RepID=UPI000B51BCE9|nr:hypothetical protein [Bdellovibrio sp. SKB1291214]UYL08367.1 hypothetical protein B9G69_015095 [Bdellovibrio sp. SKB1291214]